MKNQLLLFVFIAATLCSANAADGFYTSGTKLMDANGKEFVMRGANYSWAWQRGNESTVIPAAARQGMNCLRISISDGHLSYCGGVTPASTVANLIQLCENNKLICVLVVHDELGDNSLDAIQRAADYWASIASTLKGHEWSTIVNIANEWVADHDKNDVWSQGYQKAVKTIRNAGITNTLMIDCAGYGQGPSSIWERGAEVVAADEQKNILYSIHMYDWAGKDESTVKENIDKALTVGVPLVIGEFGYEHKGNEVAYQTILDYTKEKRVGYIGWSWTGNSSDTQALDMFGGYDDSNMKTNGEKIILGSNGIKETAEICSVYGGKGGLKTDDSSTAADDDDTDDKKGDDTGDSQEQTPATGTTTLWSGSQNADWGTSFTIDASRLSAAAVGDTLHIDFSPLSGDASPGIKIASLSPWQEIYQQYGLSGSSVEFILTQDAINYLQKSMLIQGQGMTVTCVKVLHQNATGLTSVEAEATNLSSPREYYTIDGKRVSRPMGSGLYIIRQGGKTRKISIR